MLFHDVHHAFPNAVGTMSQRGRFHGWQKVQDAAAIALMMPPTAALSLPSPRQGARSLFRCEYRAASACFSQQEVVGCLCFPLPTLEAGDPDLRSATGAAPGQFAQLLLYFSIRIAALDKRFLFDGCWPQIALCGAHRSD